MNMPCKFIESLELEGKLVKGKKYHQIVFKLLYLNEIRFTLKYILQSV